MIFIAVFCFFSCAFALPRDLSGAKFSPPFLKVPGFNGSPETHIINGDEATPGSLPWQGALYRNYYGNFYFICGCVLIDKNWVLTAAHCVDPTVDPADYRIALGDHNRTSEEGNEQIIEARKIVSHPDFDITKSKEGYPYDIALMKLSQTANTDVDGISIVALPDSCDEKFSCDDDCIISGWGRTEDWTLPEVLQYVDIDVVKQKKCRDNWGQYDVTVRDDHICVGDGKESSCSGDSGGPLTCEKNGKTVLAGVTSWGSSSCREMPSVYTRVSSYIPWIFNNMR